MVILLYINEIGYKKLSFILIKVNIYTKAKNTEYINS